MKNISVWLTSISLLLSILIGLTLSRGNADAVSDANRADDKLLIGLSMDTLKEARWKKDRDLFVQRANALGVEVKVNSANSDDSIQLRDVNSFISDGVDVIVIIAHDGAAMSKAVENAHDAGIPVIAYDRLITGSDLDLYITFDNVKVGEAQAQYLVDALGGKGKIIRIYGAPTDNNAKLFKQGQDNILQPYIERGDITVIHEDWAINWEPQNGKKITNAAITNHGHDFSAILASNDGTANGAIQALKEEGLAGKILVTGQDADLAACRYIVDGTQTMSIYKPVRELATNAAELAVKLAQGKPLIAKHEIDNGRTIVPSVFLEITAVDKNNIIDTVIKDGYHSFEDVYRNVPPEDRPAPPQASLAPSNVATDLN